MRVFQSMTETLTRTSSIKWIDARFSLQDPLAGEKAYKQEHIQDAVHWDLENDLSDMRKSGGRHPLPDREALTELFRKSGLQIDDEIVVYDDGGNPFSARAWWILKYGGFQRVSIALEGYEEIKSLGIKTQKEIAEPKRSNVEPIWNESILASKEDVQKLVEENSGELLVDARAAVRFRGEHEPLDAIAGHIPGAQNFDWSQLTELGRFNTSSAAAKRLENLTDKDDAITVYCGSGVTAAPLYAMLSEKGYSNVRLYAGSYSDWISGGDLPIETGEADNGDSL